MGGCLADRLGFFFIAGYQAAIRRTFNIKSNVWCALAVSEDRAQTNPKPGLRLADNGTISGFKTWVACAAHLDELIVSVGAMPDAEMYLLKATRADVAISVKEAPSFLSDMSQGIAEFQAVPAVDLASLAQTDLKLFAKREPLYLYFAFAAWLLKQGSPIAPKLLEQLLTIAAGDFSDPRDKATFAEVDDAIGKAMRERASLLEGNYEADKGLLSLYSPVIQKRAGRG